jgi:uncharacterized protein YkwD
MHAGRNRPACARRRLARSGCILVAALAAGCGDAVGTPIRAIAKPDAALSLLDAGHPVDAMVDATSRATFVAPGMFQPPPPGTGSGQDQGTRRSSDDVPHTAYCFNVANWPQDSESDEQQMAQAINELRSRGVRCGDRVMGSLPALLLPAALRCSARLHSLDMAIAGYQGKRGSDGTSPGERMTMAGFTHGSVAESIEMGTDASQVFINFASDSEACANLANPQFTALGIGEYRGLWTFDFAAGP